MTEENLRQINDKFEIRTDKHEIPGMLVDIYKPSSIQTTKIHPPVKLFRTIQ